jgi:hypothetical protein
MRLGSASDPHPFAALLGLALWPTVVAAVVLVLLGLVELVS